MTPSQSRRHNDRVAKRKAPWVTTAGGLPVELDIMDLARLVDQGKGVHAKALHMPVVGRDAHIVHQEGKLHHELQIRWQMTLDFLGI